MKNDNKSWTQRRFSKRWFNPAMRVMYEIYDLVSDQISEQVEGKIDDCLCNGIHEQITIISDIPKSLLWIEVGRMSDEV